MSERHRSRTANSNSDVCAIADDQQHNGAATHEAIGQCFKVRFLVKVLRRANKPLFPLFLAHLAFLGIMSFAYLACNLAWRVIIYQKSMPQDFEEQLFSLCSALELFNLIFVRSMKSASLFPRLAMGSLALFGTRTSTRIPFFWGLTQLRAKASLSHRRRPSRCQCCFDGCPQSFDCLLRVFVALDGCSNVCQFKACSACEGALRLPQG